MEETNPQGSQTDVNGAAAKIFGMLDPQPEGQAEVEAAPEENTPVSCQSRQRRTGSRPRRAHQRLFSHLRLHEKDAISSRTA